MATVKEVSVQLSIVLAVLAARAMPAPASSAIEARQVQLHIVESYLQARAATMQETASAADVEKALSFCLASVEYEHPRVGIRIEGVERLRAGMLGFLGTSRKASITVTDKLQGPDMVAVRTAVEFEGQEGGGWAPVQRSQVWIFELEGPKIKRIIEYW
jgi:SnoaL-like domain